MMFSVLFSLVFYVSNQKEVARELVVEQSNLSEVDSPIYLYDIDSIFAELYFSPYPITEEDIEMVKDLNIAPHVLEHYTNMGLYISDFESAARTLQEVKKWATLIFRKRMPGALDPNEMITKKESVLWEKLFYDIERLRFLENRDSLSDNQISYLMAWRARDMRNVTDRLIRDSYEPRPFILSF